MKKPLLTILVFLVLLSPLWSATLPAAPAGFSWQQIPELKAAVLKPDGWFFKREEQNGTLAFFITRENIEAGGDFETGLTINVFRGLPDSALDRGQVLIENIAQKMSCQEWKKTAGPFQEFGCNAQDSQSVMRYLVIANPKTNTLYLFIFESPVTKWSRYEALGQQIMNNLALDDGI